MDLVKKKKKVSKRKYKINVKFFLSYPQTHSPAPQKKPLLTIY